MQEWIVAMLVISVLLVLRDMAKVFFRGKDAVRRTAGSAGGPSSEKRVEKYAASFQKLADTFYG